MRSVLGNRTAVFDDGGRKLSITKDGISVEGKKPFSLSFSEVGAILPMRYCNSNMLYSLIFRDLQGKNISLPDLETDTKANGRGHNIAETKTLLLAFARNKLGAEFPNSIDSLDIPIAFNLKEKEIRLSGGHITGAKHSIPLTAIRRVKMVTNGTISNLGIYTKEKGGFFDFPDMSIPANELTLPVLEAAMTRNTGAGIDFSRGDGFAQKTSEFMIIRFLSADFFINEDGSFSAEWQERIYDRISAYGYEEDTLLEQAILL
jgi:hypothetical protein